MSGSTSTSLLGKVAVVTGAAQGIGYAVAKVLGLRGASVMICDLKQEDVDRAGSSLSEEYGINVHGVVCDVSKKDQVDNMIKTCVDVFKTVDVVVANAGILVAKDFLEMTKEDFEKVISVWTL